MNRRQLEEDCYDDPFEGRLPPKLKKVGVIHGKVCSAKPSMNSKDRASCVIMICVTVFATIVVLCLTALALKGYI